MERNFEAAPTFQWPQGWERRLELIHHELEQLRLKDPRKLKSFSRASVMRIIMAIGMENLEVLTDPKNRDPKRFTELIEKFGGLI